MSDIIQLLPDHVANQIAAGEVIQRPASVVKELLENSKDAGSTDIKIYVKDAGKWLIQIVDNGSGMSTIDARMAFEKHATSKIKSVEDIFKIKTMGFRGEALPSIAAIAQVELKTKTLDAEMGNSILVEGSQVVQQEPCVCNYGTSIAVKNLFYNIPARRNFLKSNSVELKHIYEEIIRFALSNPQISLQAHNDGKLWLEYPISNLKTRITRVFGSNYAEKMVDCEEENAIVNVKGFVGKPEFSKKTRGEQYFFVNNRYIRDPYLHHAVMNAYEGIIASDSFPFYVLHLSINPAEIDVNVHPGKTEIKFENDKNIYQILKASIKRSIGLFNLSPSLDFDSDPNSFLFRPSSNQELPSAPTSPINYDYNPFNEQQSSKKQSYPKQDWPSFFENFEQPSTPHIAGQEISALFDEDIPKANISTAIFQVNHRYIIAPIAKGLMLIDQKAAHEKILYTQLIQHHSPIEKQCLLYPISLECPSHEISFLEQLLPILNQMGIEIKHFGGNTFVIEAHPVFFNEEGLKTLIEQMIYDKNLHQESDVQKTRKHIAVIIAQHKSIPYGKTLNIEEMEEIVSKLFSCSESEYGIRKNKTMVILSSEEIIKLINK